MFRFVQRFRRHRAGATAIEYALIAAMIAVTITGAVRLLGQNNLTALYEGVAAAFP